MSAPDRRVPRLMRRDVLASILASGAAALPGIAPAFASPDRLADLARARGLLFGMALTQDQASRSPELVGTALGQAGMLVPGNELKWSVAEPAPGQFALSGADAVIDLARGHGLKSRGHTLVWHEALPSWVAQISDKGEMASVLARHIRTLCRHCGGRLHSWDVVNEAIQPGERADGLRQTPFLAALGPDYVERAFWLAAEADPAAELTLNEYDLERNTPWQESRRRAMLNLLDRLVRRGVPISALGIQGHLDPAKGPLDPEVFRRFIQSVASLGLKVFVTELDIIDRSLPADIAERDAAAARDTLAYLTAALAEPAVRVVVTWGVSDAFSWVDSNPQTRRLDGLPSRPHLYDAAFRPKPLRTAVATAFQNAPARVQ